MRKNFKRGLAAIATAAMVLTSVPATTVFASDANVQKNLGWNEDYSEYYYYDATAEKQVAAIVTEEVTSPCGDPVTHIAKTQKGETLDELTTTDVSKHKAETTISYSNRGYWPGTYYKPTCTKEGYARSVTTTCSVEGCGTLLKEERNVKVPALGHTYGAEQTTEPTCSTEGKIYQKCITCGDELVIKTIPADTSKHTPTKYDTEKGDVAPTCTAEGKVKEGTCSACDTKLVDYTVAATGHSFAHKTVDSKDATCEEDGYYVVESVCTVCGEVNPEEEKITVVVPALGHDWELDQLKSYAATCATEGLEVYNCAVEGCDASYEEIIPATGKHTYTGDEVIIRDKNYTAATCKTYAKANVGKECSVCHQIVQTSKEPKEIRELGLADHTYVEEDYKVTKEPKCNEDGSLTDGKATIAYCSVCEKTNIPVTIKAAHNFGEAAREITTAPNCATKTVGESYLVKTCDDCGYKSKVSGSEKEVPYEHSYDVAAVDATKHQVKCTVKGCTAVKEGTREKHDFEKNEEKSVTPNCKAKKDGILWETCSVCGYEKDIKLSYSDNTGDWHNWELDTKDKEYKEQTTCKKDGLDVFKCKDCEARKTVVVEAPKEHTYECIFKTAPTCDTATLNYGYKKCTVCGDITYDSTDKDGNYLIKCPANYEVVGEIEYKWGKISSDQKSVQVAVQFEAECQDCGKKVQISKTYNLDSSNWTTVSEATCKAAEVKAFKLDVKDATFDKTYASKFNLSSTSKEFSYGKKLDSHREAEAVKEKENPATCEETGSYELVVYCKDCDKELSRKSVKEAALGHEYDLDVEPVTEVICEGSDSEDYVAEVVRYCDRCGYRKVEEKITKKAPGHRIVTTSTLIAPATCVSAGQMQIEYTCKDCDLYEVEVKDLAKDPKSHQYEDVKVYDIETTCTEDGTYHVENKCVNCGKLSSTSFKYLTEKAPGHKEEVIPGVEPTATTEGKTESIVCSVCGEVFKEAEVIPPTGKTFSDVNGDEWYASSIYALADAGIVNGYTDGRFGVNDSITREQFAVILYNTMGDGSTGTPSYNDEAYVSDWAKSAVAWAQKEGYLVGSNNKFDPQGEVTMEMIASVLWRIEGKVITAQDLSAYPDAASVSDWALDGVKWAVANKIVGNGKTLDPTNACSRSRFARIYAVYLGLVD